VTLAGGTEESRRRVDDALNVTWPYLAELGRPDGAPGALAAAGVAADPAAAWERASSLLAEVLGAAGLTAPVSEPVVPEGQPAGRYGVHTSWLPPLLDELQGLARAHPMGRW
jgi:ring-1,2-phenylacetyl-CoA epoxidase subunit PaaC